MFCQNVPISTNQFKSMKKKLQFHDTLFKIMRITLTQVMLLIVFIGVSWANDSKAQEILNHRLTLVIAEQSIKSVLVEIEKSTEARFIYSSNIINSARKVSINVVNKPLSEVLPILLRP